MQQHSMEAPPAVEPADTFESLYQLQLFAMWRTLKDTYHPLMQYLDFPTFVRFAERYS